jgi:AraC-like DNA-binding protein
MAVTAPYHRERGHPERGRPEWVPAGAWLAPGYAEWPAPAALRGLVACLWASVVPDDADRSALVLPDGCSDLIWQQDTGGYLAGPDTGPVTVMNPAGTVLVGVRFRPGAGGQALGLPLSEVRDQRADLGDLVPAAARRLPGSLDPATAAVRMLEVAGLLVASATADAAVSRAAAILTNPAARAEEVADQVGLSARQFRRRFHAAAGYGPKTLQRVLRFQRFVRLLDAGQGTNLADAAARAGYADQSHLNRDCAELSGLTPGVLVRARVPS